MSVLKIHHLGPITDCEINIKDFTILTGPQASGKSTVAKAIFFFRTAKQDFYDQLTTFSADEYHSTLEKDLKKRLRSKFIQIFQSSRSCRSKILIQIHFFCFLPKLLFIIINHQPYTFHIIRIIGNLCIAVSEI